MSSQEQYWNHLYDIIYGSLKELRVPETKNLNPRTKRVGYQNLRPENDSEWIHGVLLPKALGASGNSFQGLTSCRTHRFHTSAED
jgi:hypothetical protein